MKQASWIEVILCLPFVLVGFLFEWAATGVRAGRTLYRYFT